MAQNMPLVGALAGLGLIVVAGAAGFIASGPPKLAPAPRLEVVLKDALLKTDRLDLAARRISEVPEAAVKPAPVPALDTAIPPDQVEEERDEPAPKVADPKPTDAKDICARTGGRRIDYERRGHRSWRCEYGR